MNMCLLEVAICEKCRSSHFQSEGGVKSLRTGVGQKMLGLEEGRYFCSGVCTPLHAMDMSGSNNIVNFIGQCHMQFLQFFHNVLCS